jgi:hypothetical protein
MKTYGGAEVQLHQLQVNGKLQDPAALRPGKEPPVPIG